MFERLQAHGPGSLTDHEVLEMLLYFRIPRRDTAPLAKAAIDRFGDLRGVLLAPVACLADMFGRDAVPMLKLVVVAVDRLALAETREPPVLRDWDGLDAYLASAPVGRGAPPGAVARGSTSGGEAEGAVSGAPGGVSPPPAGGGRARVLFLNNRNQLLSDEFLDAAAEDPDALARETARRVLALHATALILVLGRAGRPGVPTKAELALAARLKRAVGVLSVSLHDVLLEDAGGRTSLRRKGMI